MRMLINFSLFAANTVFFVFWLYLAAIFKLLWMGKGWRRFWGQSMVRIAEGWVNVNSYLLVRRLPTRWVMDLPEGLDPRASYLVLSNHRSWVDIPALQMAFSGKIPFLRFFLKKQLIWVPLLGLCWWALDFPFMRRSKDPRERERDREATKRSCAKFQEVPVSILNFAEGTRFTQSKHQKQESPYTHLLRPRAGGLSMTLEAMAGHFDGGVLDVSIQYSKPSPTFGDLLSGKIGEVRVKARPIPMPQGDEKVWINELWAQKDRDLASGLLPS